MTASLSIPGFRKILKKHDKNLSNDAGAKWRVEKVETAHFYTNKSIEKLIQETEGLVTSDLEGGDRQKAMKRLRVPPLGESQSPWITFKVSYPLRFLHDNFVIGIFLEGRPLQRRLRRPRFRHRPVGNLPEFPEPGGKGRLEGGGATLQGAIPRNPVHLPHGYQCPLLEVK